MLIAVLSIGLDFGFTHLFGVQLNFMYPWMMTALALGYMYGAYDGGATRIHPLKSKKI